MVAIAAGAAFFTPTATADAADFFVATAGNDTANNCMTESLPCQTIARALDRHRALGSGDDVINVEEGPYPENVDATAAADDGLTIRGHLDSSGAPATFVTGDGTGVTCGVFPCIVGLGSDADNANVTLENVEVDQTTLDPGPPHPSPILLEGGSDLDTVGSIVSRDGTFAAVELCNVPGSDIVNSFLDATGTDADGVNGCAEIDIVDTGIFTDEGRALDVPGTPGETTEVTRSWLSAADDSPGITASVDDNLTIDSSLVTGAATALEHLGATESDVLVNNSTLDAATPGVDDGESLVLGRSGSDPIDATVDSSIMVDQLFVDLAGAPITVTCMYSNFTDLSTPADPTGFTDNCPDSTEPGSTNTGASPASMFEGSAGPDFWSMQDGSPAIDAGQPGAVPPGLSTTDFDLDPRRVPGTAATCPDGIRDQGAFEAAAVSCTPPNPPQRTLSISTIGTGTGTVTGPGIDCGGAGHTDCSETVAQGTQIELAATAVDGSAFDGFSGGGCSASPCAVTMDASKSVTASFTDTRRGTRTLVVETTGPGTGTVTGPGIDCGGGPAHADCSQAYAAGTQVDLSATPGEDSILRRFTGAGCDADPCTVTMDISRAIVARFVSARVPHTRFARRPTKAKPKPVFRMRSTQPRSTYECRVDHGDWEECEKRVELRGLDPGRHTFRARATNGFGVTGPPARDRFRVRG